MIPLHLRRTILKHVTKIIPRVLLLFLGLSITVLLLLGFFQQILPLMPYGFSRDISQAEQEARLSLVATARKQLGAAEGSAGHKQIIDAYNVHEPLAQGYAVSYTDDWCATFVSYCAIKADLTHIIPTECGCERQIGLWQNLGRWQETDTHPPLPGDIIYYDWNVRTLGNSTGWSDHVGIVAGTWGPFIQVIEGNKEDCVSFRYIHRWDPRIRGYGLPEYEK